LPGQELTLEILAITNSLPKKADICLSQVPEATYGFPSAIRVSEIKGLETGTQLVIDSSCVLVSALILAASLFLL